MMALKKLQLVPVHFTVRTVILTATVSAAEIDVHTPFITFSFSKRGVNLHSNFYFKELSSKFELDNNILTKIMNYKYELELIKYDSYY